AFGGTSRTEVGICSTACADVVHTRQALTATILACGARDAAIFYADTSRAIRAIYTLHTGVLSGRSALSTHTRIAPTFLRSAALHTLTVYANTWTRAVVCTTTIAQVFRAIGINFEIWSHIQISYGRGRGRTLNTSPPKTRE